MQLVLRQQSLPRLRNPLRALVQCLVLILVPILPLALPPRLVPRQAPGLLQALAPLQLLKVLSKPVEKPCAVAALNTGSRAVPHFRSAGEPPALRASDNSRGAPPALYPPALLK